MKLFRLKNMGGRSWWVFADNVEEAIDISMEDPTNAKDRGNISLVGEQTNDFPNTDIASVTVKGTASIRRGFRGNAQGVWIVCRHRRRLKE